MGLSDSGVKQQALSQYGTNQATAGRALSQISPLYATELTGSDGYTPQQSANMYTATAQSSGGGQAAAVGAGNLLAARNGNIGGLGDAISAAARTAGDRNSATALDITNQSTQLANQRQQDAAKALSMIYSNADASASENLRTAASVKPFWQQALLQGLGQAGQLAQAYS